MLWHAPAALMEIGKPGLNSLLNENCTERILLAPCTLLFSKTEKDCTNGWFSAQSIISESDTLPALACVSDKYVTQLCDAIGGCTEAIESRAAVVKRFCPRTRSG